jgi:DNA-3-methyladenine glycosylase II
MERKRKVLTDRLLAQAVRHLAHLDSGLAKIADEFGPPPIWARQQGFDTLIQIILEQQVSLSSARAAYNRLLAIATPLTPERFLQFNDAELKAIGFSRQKTAYGRNLAASIAQGELNIAALDSLDDDAVRAELMRIKGIGRWTADIYLVMALLRPDVWPKGDLALAVAMQQVRGLNQRPTEEEMNEISADWQPWRAVAARLLWHYYLSKRARAAT